MCGKIIEIHFYESIVSPDHSWVFVQHYPAPVWYWGSKIHSIRSLTPTSPFVRTSGGEGQDLYNCRHTRSFWTGGTRRFVSSRANAAALWHSWLHASRCPHAGRCFKDFSCFMANHILCSYYGQGGTVKFQMSFFRPLTLGPSTWSWHQTSAKAATWSLGTQMGRCASSNGICHKPWCSSSDWCPPPMGVMQIQGHL